MPNSRIVRHEIAPSTDEEWEQALSAYGRVRIDEPISPEAPQSSLLSEVIYEEPDENVAGPSSKPLIHQSNVHELLPPISGLTNPRRDSASSERTRAGTPRSSFGSEGQPAGRPGSSGTFAFGIAETIKGPPNRGSNDCQRILGLDDGRPGREERLRLREFYEREGWLPGPTPSKKTIMRRKQACRRLGICGGDPEGEPDRRAAISKYAELAKQVFNVKMATVSIIRGDMEVVYHADPDAERMVGKHNEAICSHAVLQTSEKCTIVADVSKDWRFKNSPKIKGSEFKFYASAPLRTTYKDISVDVGTICIFHTEPRDTFDSREQSILLNLANMLVYQLTTLQSENLYKRSSTMYEASINFLRRSVVRQETAAQVESVKREKKAKVRERKDKRSKEPVKSGLEPVIPRIRSSHNLALPRPDSPVSISETGEVEMASKTGPRDSKIEKRQQHRSDKLLFDDSAATLRRILRADSVAIVDMDEYQLFIRRTAEEEVTNGKKNRPETKEHIVTEFLQGKPWPAHIDPVVQYVPRSNETGVQVLGSDHLDPSDKHNFNQPGAENTINDFLRTWLKTRHFWWDREDGDDLSQRIMGLLPGTAQTVMAMAFMTADGKIKFATFASWRVSPSSFGDSGTMALPFAWIVGGCTMAALAINKVRGLEKSQISYSNIQAHELRTPLHQILAITQLLRSAMNDLADTPQELSSPLTTTQQIRDLLPFLDAIDTSGKTLHGIVDNILSFLDLKGKDNMLSQSSPSLLNSPSGATQSIEVMFEELIHDACEEDKRSRRANGQPASHVETVFEIIPPLLGEKVTEDTGGALRRALSKILSNAYKFIEGHGCVEIYVDDVPSLLPPEGCEDLCLTKRISIKIVDNGRGMDPAFVREKLGEPWAKEDNYTTGSGLSVHLAYRIIDLMGGHMEITSGQGQGCTVMLEVPLPVRQLSLPSSPDVSLAEPSSPTDPLHLAADPDHMHVGRKVAFAGFEPTDQNAVGLPRLGSCLDRQFKKLGCEIVTLDEADLVVMDGQMEESERGVDLLREIKTEDIVFCVAAEHEAHPAVLAEEKKSRKSIRRFRKPATPSMLRECLFPGQSNEIQAEIPNLTGGVTRSSISSPDQVDSHGNTLQTNSPEPPRPRAHFAEPETPATPPISTICGPRRVMASLSSLWKPKAMPVEEAVASLCLGDYFSARRLTRTTSNTSSGTGTNTGTGRDTADSGLSTPQTRSEGFEAPTPSPEIDMREDKVEEEIVEEEPEELVKVMVVEDNMINRKILVKILSSKLPIEVLEAEDGAVAVELFRELSSPVIVLLDINMPRMDGYQACMEMRAIEKEREHRGKSQIIAVTALASEAEKRRGLVECSMDQWHSKPCSKATIHKIVEEARILLLQARSALKA